MHRGKIPTHLLSTTTSFLGEPIEYWSRLDGLLKTYGYTDLDLLEQAFKKDKEVVRSLVEKELKERGLL